VWAGLYALSSPTTLGLALPESITLKITRLKNEAPQSFPSRTMLRSLLSASLAAAALLVAAEPPPREVLDFNPGWRLLVGDPAGAHEPGFDDTAWTPITLPRAWNEDDAFRRDIKDHSTGIAWYRKKFVLPPGSAGRKVFLEFEGVRHVGIFYLNGQRIGRHENGVMAVGFDVTALVKPAPETNILAVRTDNAWDVREELSGNRFQWSDRNFNANYGGIPKNVRLHLTHPLHQTLPLYSHLGTTGVYVYATDFDIAGRSATIHAESEVRYEPREARTFTYEVTIEDRDGRVVKQFSGGEFTAPQRGRVIAKASARVDGLNFWSWGYGYLYTVTTALKLDGQVIDAVRTVTGFRKTEFKDGMLRLNDRPIHVKGYAQRTSNEWPALGLSVPPWLSDYSNGLMVASGANTVRWMHVTPWKQDVESCDRVGLMQLLPAGDSENDAQGRTWAARVELMRDAIIYNRNNPSVIFYEGGNKGIDEEHMRELVRLRDFYDPYGGRAMGAREMLGSDLAEWGGEMLYVNKSARKPLIQNEYSRDEGLRKYWDEFSPPFHKDGDGPLYNGQDARTYNRNQDSHAIENVVRWHDFWRERPGTGARVNGGGLNIIFSDTNTHHRGAENYRRSGEVDPVRIPKDGFFAHQVMWDGWVDVEQPRAHIIGHWNYAAGVKKDVHVVSTADAVELFLNGRSLGRGSQRARFLFTVRGVAWEPGTLTAVGYDARGAKVVEVSQVTAGEPAALKLTSFTGPGGLRADGADVALVQVEVVDAQGRRSPTALNPVDFELTGPADWRGGIAQGPDNFILARSLSVEGGVNRVLVRSTTQAGRIAISAKSAGLATASLELDSTAVESADGWSRDAAARRLSGRLDRGPTPRTPAFTSTRVAVPVTRVVATDGGNPAYAIDDNEATAWSGKKPIVFELAREARISQVTMKTAGFRARSYPIRVSVGDTEVWRGPTPRGLGYITLPFEITTGHSVTIEVLGGSEARDAFGGMRELEDQGNARTGEENVGSGELGLIEVEFYEPAP
jgi:beta-galactosidase